MRKLVRNSLCVKSGTASVQELFAAFEGLSLQVQSKLTQIAMLFEEILRKVRGKTRKHPNG